MNQKLNLYGFRFGMAAFIANALFVFVQTLQLIRILKYPLDDIFIYGFSLCIVIPFVLEMLSLYYVTPADKKFWSHAALTFTIIYAVFVTANYVVQLATVIPMSLNARSSLKPPAYRAHRGNPFHKLWCLHQVVHVRL